MCIFNLLYGYVHVYFHGHAYDCDRAYDHVYGHVYDHFYGHAFFYALHARVNVILHGYVNNFYVHDHVNLFILIKLIFFF